MLRRLRPGGALLVLLLASAVSRAQVVDDSTKVLYGPKTTRVIYEAEVLRDSTNGTPLDTTLTRWPQDRFWFHDTTFQQDIGTVGSASRPLLYQPNLQLGARFGRNVFDKYARDPRTIPYYDSRSPYSFFRFIQSSAGEQVFELSYSRSLKKNFSVGFAYERIASNKVLAFVNSRDGLVEHSNILLFGRYQNESERYHLLFNYTNVRHRAQEQGGIRPITSRGKNAESDSVTLGEASLTDLFKYGQQRVYLSKASNYEDRDEFYLTHTYRLLGRGLTVYHTFDALRQYNSYIDEALVSLNPAQQSMPRVLYYPRVQRNSFAVLDRAEYRQLENTVGLLGRTNGVEYRVYGRLRNYGLRAQSLKVNLPGALPVNTGLTLVPVGHIAGYQGFVGGTAAFTYRQIYAVEAAGEYKFFDEYWLRAGVRTGPLSAELLRTSYAPTLTQQQFVGNSYMWDHQSGSDSAFHNTTASQLTGRLRLKLPDAFGLRAQRFEASVSGVNIASLVYYGPHGLPVQENSASRNLLIVQARHEARLGQFGIDNQATYTQGGDVNGLRIPALVSNSRLFFESHIFRKALFSQTGIEMYYQSRLRAFDYSPSTQQFYQQDHFTIRNYAVANAFFSADIKTVSVFLKVAYLNQGILHNGYFTSPYYTGYPRRFQFGIKWNFFS